MTSNVLPLFWHLSSTSKPVRLEATEQLVNSLESFQADFITTSNVASSSDLSKQKNVVGSTRDQDDSEVEGQEESQADNDSESGVEVDGDSDDDDLESPGDKGLEDAVRKMDEIFDRSNSEDVKYTVKRLIRGLGSSRESSRLGFAVALTEIISRLKASSSTSISPEHILSLILRSSATSAGQKGAEERDLLFARLFGLNSLIDSGILIAAASADTWESVAEELVALGEKKSWLRESCWWSLVKAVRALYSTTSDHAVPAWRASAINSLVQLVYMQAPEAVGSLHHGKRGKTSEGGLDWTQEKLALTLLLQEMAPTQDWKELLSPTFRYPGLLASPNLSALGRILKETDVQSSENGDQSGMPAVGGTGGTGSWKPQVHFVWDIIFETYFHRHSDESGVAGLNSGKRAPFAELFRVVVDETLLASNSSPSRKYWGFEIFSKALPLLPNNEVPLVFTKNFMKVWMGHLSGEDKLLHKAAIKITKQMQEVISVNPFVGFTLLSQLLGNNGSHNFDRLTKTKTVEGIMLGLDAAGIQQYISYLKGLISGTEPETEGSDVEPLNSQRSWVFEQMLALLRNSSISKEDDSMWSILEFLLLHGCFVLVKSNKKSHISSMKSKPKPALSETLSADCRRRFFSAVIEVTVQTRHFPGADAREHTKRVQGCDTAGQSWLSRCLELVAEFERDSTHISAAVDVDNEIREARSKAQQTLATLRSSSKLSKDVARGLEILLAFATLRTYDDDVSALETLEDVHLCARQLLDIKPSATSASENLPPVDVLVDVLVQYLDISSSEYRALSSTVFSMISAEATLSSTQHLIAQLEESGDVIDDNDLGVDNDSPGLDTGSQNSSRANSDTGDVDGDEGSSSEEDDQEDDEDLTGTDVDPEFRRKVEAALRAAGMADNGDAESSEGSDGDSDESDDVESFTMDDDQMLALDDKLAEIFRQQKSTANEKKGRGSVEAVHFKARILELIDIFLKKQPTNALVLAYILPLLRLAAEPAAAERQLATKASSILRDRVANSKEIPAVTDIEFAAGVLDDVHLAARTAGSKEISALCSQCSIQISKALYHMPLTLVRTVNEIPKPVVNAYSESLKEFMTRKSSRLHASFFLDFINRQPIQAWSLRDDILGYARREKGINEHHQATAIDFTSAIAKHTALVSKAGFTDQVVEWVVASRKCLYQILEVAGTPEGTLLAPRVKDVLKSAIQVCRHSKAVFQSEQAIAEAWAADALGTIGVQLAIKFKETKSVSTLFSQLELLVSPAAQQLQAQRKRDKLSLKRKRRQDDVPPATDAASINRSTQPSKQQKITKGPSKAKSGGSSMGKKQAARDVELMDLDM